MYTLNKFKMNIEIWQIYAFESTILANTEVFLVARFFEYMKSHGRRKSGAWRDFKWRQKKRKAQHVGSLLEGSLAPLERL